MMSVGHIGSDINQGALSAIIPFLVAAYHYDYAQVGTLVMFFSLIGSIVQPMFGNLADKHYSPLILPCALLLASGGMALTTFTDNYILLCAFVVISGIGVAMFHPVGILIVNKTAPKDAPGTAVSIFATGGSLGFTLGPIAVGIGTALFGLKGTLLLMVPTVIVIAFLCLKNKEINELMDNSSFKKKAKKAAGGEDNWLAFYKLCGVIFGRSIIFYSLNTFIVLYWMDALGQSKGLGTTMLSIFFACGTLSTMVCGKIADKVGYRKMIRLSFTTMFPCLLAFCLFQNLYMATVLIIPLGLAMNANYSSFVVLSQKYLPNHPGLAGGVSLGLAVSVGGIVTPMMGHLADTYGLIYVFYAATCICLIPLISSYILPPDPVKEA